jgi:hypothetical protein
LFPLETIISEVLTDCSLLDASAIRSIVHSRFAAEIFRDALALVFGHGAKPMLDVSGTKDLAPVSVTRTPVLYWTYLGAAWSRSKLTGERLERTVAELKRIALGGPFAKRAVNEDSRRLPPSRRRRG